MLADTNERRSLRAAIDVCLQTDQELDAFCIDFFPLVHRRFSNGMDRHSKVNLLFILVDIQEIADKLRLCTEPERRVGSRASSGSTVASAVLDDAPVGPDNGVQWAGPVQRHEKNESIEFSSLIRQIGKSQQSYGNQHSRLSLIITAIGIAILPIASLGAGLTTANYQKSFISIAAMGGCYLVFGLFFANISMFPGKHRSRILSILVVGFILITIALVARAAKCYYQGRTVSDNKQPSGSVPQKHNNKNSQGSASRRAVELSSQVQVNVPDAHKTTKPRNRLAIGGGLVSFAQRVATPKPSPEELADKILEAVDFGVRTSPDLGLRTELQKDDNQFSETIQHHFSNKRTSHICIGNMYVSNNPLMSYDILPEEFFRKIICEEIQLHFSRGISPVTVSITEHCNDEGRLHLNIRGYINSIIYNDKLSHEVICELALDWTDQADHSGRPSSIYTRNKKATKVFVAKRTIFNMKERSQHLHDVCRAIIQSSFKEEPEFWSVIYNTTEVQ